MQQRTRPQSAPQPSGRSDVADGVEAVVEVAGAAIEAAASGAAAVVDAAGSIAGAVGDALG